MSWIRSSKPGPGTVLTLYLAAALAGAAVLSGCSDAVAAAPGAHPASVASSKAAVPAKLQRTLGQFARAHPGFPGVALAVQTPRLTWSGAAGVADRASRAPLRPDTTLRIASVTKTFTAAAVLRLVEDGKVALNDPISRRLSPSTLALLRSGGYDVDAIHVRHLLMHTGGLYDYAEDPSFQQYVLSHPRHRWTRAEQVRFAMTHGKPLFRPGVSFHYSDTGYVLLGEMLERTTGRSLAGAYRTLLHFDRLGLHTTYLETLEPKPAGAKPRAHQYLGSADTTAFDPSFDLYGGGGLVSTVDDLARFYRVLFDGRVFTKAATLRTMLDIGPSGEYGMGIFRKSFGRETCWGHNGFWGIAVYHCPHARITIASTVNQRVGFESATQQLETTVMRLVG